MRITGGSAGAAALVCILFAGAGGDRGSNLRGNPRQPVPSTIGEGNQQFQASRISFRQLCFSFSRDGQGAHDAAAYAFVKVSAHGVDSDGGMASLADHLTLRSYYGDLTPDQVDRVFGTAFTESLFRLKPGRWQGPIKSGLGWHLVWIDRIARASAVAGDEVKSGAEGILKQGAELRKASDRP